MEQPSSGREVLAYWRIRKVILPVSKLMYRIRANSLFDTECDGDSKSQAAPIVAFTVGVSGDSRHFRAGTVQVRYVVLCERVALDLRCRLSSSNNFDSC